MSDSNENQANTPNIPPAPPAILMPGFADRVVLVAFSGIGGKIATKFDAIAVGGTVDDLSVIYLDLTKKALFNGTDWRNAFIRVDRVVSIDHPDVAKHSVGFLWYPLTPREAANQVEDANDNAQELADNQAKKTAEAEAAAIQKAAEIKVAAEMAAEKTEAQQKAALAAARTKLTLAAATAEVAAAQQGNTPPLSEAQQKAAELKKTQDEAAAAEKQTQQANAAVELKKAQQAQAATSVNQVKPGAVNAPAAGFIPAIPAGSPYAAGLITETVTYKDGSSATGPGPLPRTSPEGSPAIASVTDVPKP